MLTARMDGGSAACGVVAAHAGGGTGRRGAVADLAGGVIAALVREYRVRRDMRQLLALSDAMLRDIGVDRSEIEQAVRLGRCG